MTLTPELLAELRRKAAEATRGPWHATPEHHPKEVFHRRLGKKYLLAECFANGKTGPETSANAVFIAAADPPTVTALVEEVERLRDHIEAPSHKTIEIYNEAAALRAEVERLRACVDVLRDGAWATAEAERDALRAQLRDYEAALGRVHPVVCLVPGAMNQGECHVCAALAKWRANHAG